MKNGSHTPPILLIGYKRPVTTRLVFAEIRKARPKKLFFAVDGPKRNDPLDLARVNEVRDIILGVDWDCEVRTYFADENLGSKLAESSAINFFFEHVTEGVILEDDCLPDQSFFNFCGILLAKYRYDDRIMHISGNNFQQGRLIGEASYYYSRHMHGWGWATWKRAWKYYDVDMNSFPNFKSQKHIEKILTDVDQRKFYLNTLERVHRGEIDCWDYQWMYAIWCQNGLCINPNQNLVSNIGFGKDGTYCLDETHMASNIKSNSIVVIVSPVFMVCDNDADNFVFRNFIQQSFSRKLKSRIMKVFRIFGLSDSN